MLLGNARLRRISEADRARQTISSDSSDEEIDGSAKVRSDAGSSTSVMQESLTERPPVPVDTAEKTPQPSQERDVNEPTQTEQEQPSASVAMAKTLSGAELAELNERENDNRTPSELPEITA